MRNGLEVAEVIQGSELFEAVLLLADQVLQQRRHITSAIETAREDHVLGVFDGDRCVGFLRFFVQSSEQRSDDRRCSSTDCP